MKPCRGSASRTGRWVMKKFANNRHPLDGRRLRTSIPYFLAGGGRTQEAAGYEGEEVGNGQGVVGTREEGGIRVGAIPLVLGWAGTRSEGEASGARGGEDEGVRQGGVKLGEGDLSGHREGVWGERGEEVASPGPRTEEDLHR